MPPLQHPLHVPSVFSALLAVSALALGCGKAAKMEPDRPASVDILMPVVDLNDLSGDRDYKHMATLFVSGREPSLKDCQRYAQYRYKGKNPRQSGNTATAIVTVKDAKTGKEVGEVTWTMKRKVGGFWKLMDAPLPAE